MQVIAVFVLQPFVLLYVNLESERGKKKRRKEEKPRVEGKKQKTKNKKQQEEKVGKEKRREEQIAFPGRTINRRQTHSA